MREGSEGCSGPQGVEEEGGCSGRHLEGVTV